MLLVSALISSEGAIAIRGALGSPVLSCHLLGSIYAYRFMELCTGSFGKEAQST